MGYKVFDFWCEDCDVRLVDELVHVGEDGDLTEPGPNCPNCGKETIKLMPAPAGVVYDAGQMASKKALARAFRTKSKAVSYRPDSAERKEAMREANHLMKPGVT